ncbi:hypothetical protein B0H11DRAFT_2057400 [Mycena galericulata]|nr:hypothetical protein B0H11DRAFT_2057400 [Mycena galericulata]
MTSFSAMWWGKWHPPADPTHLSFKGKTVLVTGANSGLGHEATVKYAALGASTLILGVRTNEKGEEAKADIIERTHCSPDIFIIETVDLSTLASVKAFVDRVKARVPELHVVQLVAGIMNWDYEKSPDGYEMSLQVNVLSTGLMALLLLPKLRETAAAQPNFTPHMSVLLSVAAWEVQDNWLPPGQSLIQRCDDAAKWDNIKQYFLIKLATWYVVTCSGLCKTRLNRNLPLAVRIFMAIQYFLLGRSAEQGARTLVSATDLGPESTGKFWRNDEYFG